MATGQTKNKSGNFLVQGSILAIAGIIVRLIGLAYRIPLIRIIGDEGMGYYSVAFEVYSVILLLSSYSLPLAVSKMVSAKIAEDDYLNADRIFKVSLIYATIVGFVGCIFVWLSADWFANVFYKLPLCKYALISLAPTIWIAAYLGVLRGYYQGRSTMVPTAVSQIFEQIVNAFVSVGAAWWLCDMALKAAKGESVASAWGAAGGTIGTGAGALAALIILIVLLKRNYLSKMLIRPFFIYFLKSMHINYFFMFLFCNSFLIEKNFSNSITISPLNDITSILNLNLSNYYIIHICYYN